MPQPTNSQQGAPTLARCPFCPTERREAHKVESGAYIGVIIHDLGCYLARHHDDRRQVLTPSGIEAWNTRADLSPVVDVDAEQIVVDVVNRWRTMNVKISRYLNASPAAVAQLCEMFTEALTAAVDKQREVDAEIADAEFQKEYPGKDYGDLDDSTAYRIAAAIRAGKK